MCDVQIFQTIRTKNAFKFRRCKIFVNAGKKGGTDLQLKRNAANKKKEKETT